MAHAVDWNVADAEADVLLALLGLEQLLEWLRQTQRNVREIERIAEQATLLRTLMSSLGSCLKRAEPGDHISAMIAKAVARIMRACQRASKLRCECSAVKEPGGMLAKLNLFQRKQRGFAQRTVELELLGDEMHGAVEELRTAMLLGVFVSQQAMHADVQQALEDIKALLAIHSHTQHLPVNTPLLHPAHLDLRQGIAASAQSPLTCASGGLVTAQLTGDRRLSTLQHLADALGLAVSPAVFDLGGATLQGGLEGSLGVWMGGHTIRNGTLLFPQGRQLIISTPAGSTTVLEGLTIISQPSDSQPSASSAPSTPPPSLSGNARKKGSSGGGSSSNRKGTVSSVCSGCLVSLVHVSAGHVRMEGCTISQSGACDGAGGELGCGSGPGAWGCEQGDGLLIQGPGSWVCMVGSRVHGCQGSCIRVESGGVAELDGCEVYRSETGHGALVTGVGSRLSARGSQVHDSSRSNVVVEQGGEVVLSSGCRVHGCLRHHGLEVRAGGSARATDCEFSGNGDSNVAVHKGGSLALTGCQLHSSDRQGLRVHKGGHASVINCALGGNLHGGVRSCVSERASGKPLRAATLARASWFKRALATQDRQEAHGAGSAKMDTLLGDRRELSHSPDSDLRCFE